MSEQFSTHFTWTEEARKKKGMIEQKLQTVALRGLCEAALECF